MKTINHSAGVALSGRWLLMLQSVVLTQFLWSPPFWTDSYRQSWPKPGIRIQSLRKHIWWGARPVIVMTFNSPFLGLCSFFKFCFIDVSTIHWKKLKNDSPWLLLTSFFDWVQLSSFSRPIVFETRVFRVCNLVRVFFSHRTCALYSK